MQKHIRAESVFLCLKLHFIVTDYITRHKNMNLFIAFLAANKYDSESINK